VNTDVKRTPRVILAGDVMHDVIVRPEGPLRKGSDRSAAINISPGGSASNQAVWLAACGVAPVLIARVGASECEILRKQFAARGVEAYLAADPELPTGVLVSLIDPDGERSFFTDRGANKNLHIDNVPEKVLEKADLLLLSGYSFFADGPRQVALELMAQAKKAGILVAIDPASAGFLADAGLENFISWTSGADILFPNVDEARILSGSDNPEKQIRILGEFYGLVVLTRGSKGACAGGKNNGTVSASSPKVTVVDSTGAGDAFAAGFLARYLDGAPLKTCLENGVLTGAQAITQAGGQPRI
jgi:sugar/nucleoside kinase (ribokinase family)